VLEEQNKGQDFVSQRNLKNQLFGKKNEDVGALNRTMSSFSTRNIKALDNLTKQMSVLNQNILKMTKPSQEKKSFVSKDLVKKLIKGVDDLEELSKEQLKLKKMTKPSQEKKSFVRREDPVKKLIKGVDDLEELSKEQLKLEKEKKKGKGLLGMLGMIGVGLSAAIAGSGLIGFLLTGKSEFLHSVVKGIKKAVWDIPKLMFSGFKGLKSLKPAKSLFKIVDVVKDIGKFGRLLSKTFSRFGFKGVGTLVGRKIGKTMSKKAATKIPGIGTILGIMFGINRFRKGDILGGIGEIVSGVIPTLLPGAGVPISLAIDALLLLKDFKSIGKKKEKKPKKGSKIDMRKVPFIGGYIDFFEGVKMIFGGAPMEGIKMALLGLNTFQIPGMDWLISKTLFPLVDGASWLIKTIPGFIGKTAKAAVSMAPAAYKTLKKVPVIGWYISGIEGIINFAKDPKKGVENIANFMNNMIPGSGDLVLKAGNAIFGAADWIKSKAGSIRGWVADKGKKASDAIQKLDKSVEEELRTTAARKAPQVTPQSAKQKKGLLQKFKKKVASSLGGMVSGAQEMMYENERPEKDSRKRGIESIAGERGVGWYTYKPWSPQIGDLNKDMWNNFTGMAKEYFSETGDLIQINSAYRNQRDSVHGAGYAIDINSSNANALERMGLMKKWGFHRPLLNWEEKKETWHVEPYPGSDYGPRNTNNFAIRHAVAQGKTDFGGGGLNMPRNQIAGKSSSNQKEKLDLSDSTIQALANAMGASFKGAIPRQSRGALGASAEMRG